MKLRLTTQVGLLSAARALGQILNALVGIVVVRKLSQFDYGTFRQLFLLAATLLQTELGFVETLYFFLPTLPRLRALFMRQTLVIVGSMQLLAGIVLVIFRQPIASFFNNSGLVPCMELLAFYSGFTILTRIWEVELVADKRVTIAAGVSLGFESLKVILMVVTLSIHPGIRALLLALVAAAALKFATFAIFLCREFGSFGNAGSIIQGLPQIRYAMALWIPALLNGAIGGQAHQYIVGHYFNPSEYATYAVACFQVPFVAILTNSISEVLLVRATEYANQGRRQELYALWINASRKGLLLYIAISTVLMVLARPLIVTLFTERYRSSAPLFALMVLGFLSYGVFQDALFRACSAMRTYGFFYALRAVLSVGLAFVGLRLWGVWGVALSTVLAVGIVNIFQLVPAARLLQVSFTRVLPWKDVAKMLVAAAAAGSATAALSHNVSRELSLIVGFPLFLAVYGGLAVNLGVISKAEVMTVLHEAKVTCVKPRLIPWKNSVAAAGISNRAATS